VDRASHKSVIEEAKTSAAAAPGRTCHTSDTGGKTVGRDGRIAEEGKRG